MTAAEYAAIEGYMKTCMGDAEAFYEAMKEEVIEIHRYRRCLEDAISD